MGIIFLIYNKLCKIPINPKPIFILNVPFMMSHLIDLLK